MRNMRRSGSRCRSTPSRAASEDRSMLDRFQPSILNTKDLNTKDLPNSLEAVNDYFYEQGWTDGLPIIPPTPERVEHMLSGMSWRSADALIGFVPPAMGVATLRTIATNAV